MQSVSSFLPDGTTVPPSQYLIEATLELVALAKSSCDIPRRDLSATMFIRLPRKESVFILGLLQTHTQMECLFTSDYKL